LGMYSFSYVLLYVPPTRSCRAERRDASNSLGAERIGVPRSRAESSTESIVVAICNETIGGVVPQCVVPFRRPQIGTVKFHRIEQRQLPKLH